MFNINVFNEKESLIRKYTSLVKKYDDGISFAIGEPMFDVDEKIINRTIKELNNKKYKYCSARGDDELLNQISLKENVLKENILVTFGSSEGIFISLLGIINNGDEVIVISPSYPQYAPVIKFCGGEVVYVDTLDTNYIPTYKNIKTAITSKTKAIIINTPANPTGVLYDKKTLMMIENVVKESNVFLIMDDVYEELVYTKKDEYVIEYDKKITLKSFSKTYGMTGFRLGYIISTSDVIDQLYKVHSYLVISNPIFIQKAGVEALKIKEKNYNKIISNLALLRDFLNKNDIEYIPVEGGIFAFLNISKYNLNSMEFCDKLLEKYHVSCIPGCCFNAENYIRINFAVKIEDLTSGLEKIKEFIDEIKKG